MLFKQETIKSLPQSNLETVIIELARELVVVLGDGLSCGSSTLSEHRWQVGGLCVHILLAPCLAHVTLKSVWIDDCLNSDAVSVNHIARRLEVSLLKGFLSWAVTSEQMVLHAALSIDHKLLVVVVFFLSLKKVKVQT